MKRIETDVIAPDFEQETLMDWAAKADAALAEQLSSPQLGVSVYRQLRIAASTNYLALLDYAAVHDDMSFC